MGVLIWQDELRYRTDTTDTTGPVFFLEQKQVKAIQIIKKQGYFTLVINSNLGRFELGPIGLNWVESG